MNELMEMPSQTLICKKRKFEITREQIDKLIKAVPKSVGLTKFETSGSILPWNNHNVTGKEINQDLVTPLQIAFQKNNESIKRLYEICDQIYKTIDTLDNEYISGIVGAVDAATVASNQAIEAWRDANVAISKANIAQSDIKRTIEVLQTMVQALNRFKEDVKDRIPNHHEVADIHRDIKQLEVNLNGLGNRLSDIDKSFVNAIANVKQSLIAHMLSYKKHYESVGNTINKVRSDFVEYKNEQSAITEMLLSQVKKIEQDNKTTRYQFGKKLKIAYLASAAAIVVSVLQIVLYWVK